MEMEVGDWSVKRRVLTSNEQWGENRTVRRRQRDEDGRMHQSRVTMDQAGGV